MVIRIKRKNQALISKHLFRVQKFSEKDYWFRHHLESQIIDLNELSNKTFIRKRNPSSISSIIKVRTNHLGEIIHIGEY